MIDVKDYRSYCTVLYRKILYCTIKIIRLRIFLRSALFLLFNRYVERLMNSDKGVGIYIRILIKQVL